MRFNTNIKKIFKDSLSYPIEDIDKLLTFGVLFFFDAILSLLSSMTIALNQVLATQILYFLSNIVGIIIIIIAGGYLLNIIKNTIDNSNETPTLKIFKNFFGGIKIVVISRIYYIIPILTIISAYLMEHLISSLT